MSEETGAAMRPWLLAAIAVGIFVVIAAAPPVSQIAIDQLPQIKAPILGRCQVGDRAWDLSAAQEPKAC
jgi:hypothetical protein